MKVVLDTNVIISGLITSNGAPAEVIDFWINGFINVVSSPPLIQESLEVIVRPKFKSLGTIDERCDLIKKLFVKSEIVIPTRILTAIPEDEDDNRVLECAVTAAVSYIISGDFHLRKLGSYEGIKIQSPDEFLKVL